MKLKVLIICGCKVAKKKEEIYRKQQSYLLAIFTKYSYIKEEDLDFFTLNMDYENSDYYFHNYHIYDRYGYFSYLNRNVDLELKNSFDFLIYEHCPKSLIPEEHKVYSDLLKLGGYVLFYSKVDYENIIDRFLNEEEIPNYMQTNFIYNNTNYYYKVNGITFMKLK